MRLRSKLVAVVVAVATATAVASCSSTGTSPRSSESPTGSLQIFSWWTASAEAAALKALMDNYVNEYPGVHIVNAAVAGGGGGNAKAVLQSRLQGGDAPDSWQTSPGSIMKQYVDAGVVQPVTDIYDNKLRSAIPAPLLKSMSVGNDIYGSATGVHRGNVLFYNKALLAKSGIEVTTDTTMTQFVASLQRLGSAGVTPFCLGDATIFGDQVILDSLILSSVGAHDWPGLFTGNTKWTDPRIGDALGVYGQLLRVANSDHSALTSSDAATNLAKGKCAFYIAGDWAYGYLLKAGAKDGTDFGYVPVPGTSGDFIAIVDSFVVAKAGKNQANAMKWVKSITTVKSQQDFNLQKGAIPVRTDVPMDAFPPYQRQSAADFKSGELIWGLASGEVGSPSFVQAYGQAITVFNGNHDVNQFQKAMSTAAASS